MSDPKYFTSWTTVVARVCYNLRRVYKVTQGVWASQLGFSKPMISNYETGKNLTSLVYPFVVARLVGVRATDIIDLAEWVCEDLESIGVVVLKGVRKEAVPPKSWDVFDLRYADARIMKQLAGWPLNSREIVVPLRLEIGKPHEDDTRRSQKGRFRTTEFG